MFVCVVVITQISAHPNMCNARHSILLHSEKPNSVLSCSANHIVADGPDKAAGCSLVSVTIISTYMSIVQVSVNHNMFGTCVLLDTASSKTFINERAVQILGLSGECVNYSSPTLNNSTFINNKMVHITLYSVSGEKSLPIIIIIMYFYSASIQLPAQ